MEERARIEALLASGKITQDEANLLLSALAEAEEANQTFEQVDQAVGQIRVEPVKQVTPEASAQAPTGSDKLRWVKIELTAGNLTVNTDPTLSEPRVTSKHGLSDVQIVAEDSNYRVRASGEKDAGWFGFLKGATFADVEVAVPQGFGLEISTRAGNVTVNGTPYLKGSVSAGQLVARDIGGLDVEVRAGNFEGSARLNSGQHRLSVAAGNAELKILPESDYRLSGSVVMGNLETTGRYKNNSSGMRQTVNVLHGEGKADLRVDVKMGNCWIDTGA